MRPCERPGCPGRVMATGFCDTCLRRALPPSPAPDPPPADLPPADLASADHAPDHHAPDDLPPADRPPTVVDPVPDAVAAPPPAPDDEPPPVPPRPEGGPPPLDADGLVILPDVGIPSPDDLIITDPGPPTPRRCGVNGCGEPVGVGYGGRPALARGYCPRCGAAYSFEPQLHPGDEVDDGHYRVIGLLARSGIGWVYLAEDTRVEGHLVVLKGLINTHDTALRLNAVEEGRRLSSLHHRDIVGIVTRIEHTAPGEPEPTEYIVMEFVGGYTLRQLLDPGRRAELFGEPFLIDHVITYGCKILGALEYLHDRGLLYCDLKPDNVIHYGRQIKVIDLGAIRRIGDDTSALVHTAGFSPPKSERDQGRFDYDFDLHTVGATLDRLARLAEAPDELVDRSFQRVIQRARHPERAARFHSAAEMSRQLWEVLREHRALTSREQYGDRSTHFEQTPVLFGSDLGAIPSPKRWTRPVPDAARHLAIGPPDAAAALRGLPVPIADPRDPAAGRLPRLAPDNPKETANHWPHDPALRTAEVALWLCRAFAARGDAGEAERWLHEAGTLSPRAAYDWRLDWHRGVLHLCRDEIAPAQQEFAAVYTALPGEWAPKLALGYCAERLAADSGRPQPLREAESYYKAVWTRDLAQGSAAFGLARIHLGRGERAAAVAVLDAIPPTSHHFAAARIAAVRVHAGCLAGAAPTEADLKQVDDRLPGLQLDWGERDGESRERLVAEIRETAWLCTPERGWGEGFPAGELFGTRGTARELSALLAQSFRRMAVRTNDTELSHELFDRDGQVRPETPF